MFRYAGCAFLALLCVVSPSVLAQNTGSGQVNVTIVPPANPTSAGQAVTTTVQPVPGAGPTAVANPSGTITIFDGSTALNPGGTPIVANAGSTAATFAKVFGTPDPALTANQSQPSGVFGDFNEDGVPDLLLYGSSIHPGTTNLQVFASASGGTFVSLPLQSFTLPSIAPPNALAVLDVNGDGHLDLLFKNTVVYGKGDGTFGNPAVLPVLASGFSQSYAADVNGDGKLDIVAVNTPPNPGTTTGPTQYTFTVFRNDGAGTFTSLGSFALAAPVPASTYAQFNVFGLCFADVNGDGKIDVLSQSNAVASGNAARGVNLNLVLNVGNGSFGSPLLLNTSNTLSLGYDAAAFADLNGDGKLDLVLAYSHNSGGNYAGSALGNGDGTFGPVQELLLDSALTPGNAIPSLQVGDFNLDGKLDAVLGTVALALGNGDGTFSLATPLFPEQKNANGYPVGYPLLQAPLTPDAFPSFVYLNLTSGANAVFTPANSSSVTTNLTLSEGMHSLTAHYSGDASYPATVSPAVPLQIAAAATSLTLTSSANEIYAGQSVTFTATLGGATAGATGTITFYDAYPGSNPLSPILSPTPTVIGTVAIANGMATLPTSQLASGYHTITAQYSGDANNAAGTGQLHQTVDLPFSLGNSGAIQSLTVKSGQSVSSTFTVSALGGFSGPVTFSCYGLPAVCAFSPAPANISGTAATTVTMTVTATQPPSTASLETGAARTVLACGVPVLALLVLLPAARRRSLLSVMLLVVCGAFVMSCGGSGQQGTGGSSGAKTAPGNYPFYLIATSGQNVTAINYTLIVQ